MGHSVITSNHGQVIEYIQDRLYLASYSHPPTASTPFPYHLSSPAKSPSKRARGHQNVSTGPAVHPPAYFTMDDTLLYNAFHHDFGPLHIGHLYRFAVTLHDVLGDPANEGRGVVFWSKPNAKARANAACLLACYMVLIQSWPPHLALAPISQADPPLMPFRDAGYSQADYSIGVQDVVYGVWKAKEEGLCGLKDFSLEEYERYERVDMGDFNWITPSFLAFASPQHQPTASIPESSSLYAALPKTLSDIQHCNIPTPFKNVLSHFTSRNIGLVVRLNSELYSPSYFTSLGITHMDMIFDDGTCPPLPLVRKFIRLAHNMINVKHRGIAVHCKAGLGRTGCLIGAYLIYRNGFTANEIISFMRFMRPGMVVGPQQHWLHLHQGAFREWWFEDTLAENMKSKLSASQPVTPAAKGSGSVQRRLTGSTPIGTPPNGSQSRRSALGEIDHNESPTAGNVVQDENLPAPTPGQPRKASRAQDRHHPYSRHVSATFSSSTTTVPQDTQVPQQANEVVSASLKRRSDGDADSASDEEYQLRRMLARRTASRSPPRPGALDGKPRAVTYTATTTTTQSYTVDGATANHDIENWQIHADEEAVVRSEKSGSGKIRSPKRSEGGRGSKEGGVRKTSARVASVGSAKKTHLLSL